ncbi:MAG: DoxX family protein [Burkholderiales bacterium]
MMPLLKLALNCFIDPGLGSSPDQAPSRMATWVATLVSHAQSLALLVSRLYLAQIFFSAGRVKLMDWSSTLSLFQDYYQVPLLPPTLAAYMGAGGEIVLPVLLVLGLGGRFAGAGLFVVNLMAAMSLPPEDFSAAIEGQHILWGVLSMVIALWGSGRWSVDAWLARRKN